MLHVGHTRQAPSLSLSLGFPLGMIPGSIQCAVASAHSEMKAPKAAIQRIGQVKGMASCKRAAGPMMNIVVGMRTAMPVPSAFSVDGPEITRPPHQNELFPGCTCQTIRSSTGVRRASARLASAAAFSTPRISQQPLSLEGERGATAQCHAWR